jgi:membrane protease YdiL (CAAX protease family)
MTGGAVAVWAIAVTPLQTAGVGVATTIVLGGMLGVARVRRLDVALPLVVLLGISVFGWATVGITAIRPVHQWITTVPAPYAFAFVAAVKYISVAGVLYACRRQSPRSLLIQPGHPIARTGLRLGSVSLRWRVVGPLMVAAVLALLVTSVELNAARWTSAARLAAIIIAAAILNAVAEELLYRHTLITTLVPLTAPTVAVVYSSLVFGSAHLSGNPGGVVGFAYTTVFGALCAWAMLTTRGMCWNVPIHIAGDVGVQFTLL